MSLLCLSNRGSLWRLVLLCVAGVLLGPFTVAGNEWFVDRNHPAASDANPGTEALPFKTIQAGVNAAQPGDTIWIKGGVYEESTILNKAGTPTAPITISAWSNDAVRIGSVLQSAPPAASWTNVPGTLSWATVLSSAQPTDMVVVLDGKIITTEHTNTPPLDRTFNWATYRAADRTLMINIGGANPALGHDIQLARNFVGFRSGSDDCSYWVLRHLEFGWLQAGIQVHGHAWAIEDCYFHDLMRFGIFPHGHVTTIARCNFWKCMPAILASGEAAITILEDGLFIDCSGAWFEDPVWRRSIFYGASLSGDPGCEAVEFKGGGFAHVLRYNIFDDNRSGALWYDGGETTQGRMIGNAFWECGGPYNEYAVNDTLYLGNYFYYSGIMTRHCTRVDVVDNFFYGGNVTWMHHAHWQLANSYMILRGNAFVAARYGYLWMQGGWGEPYMNTNAYRTCLVDQNRIRVPTNCPWLYDGTQVVSSISAIRSTYGWELHGDGQTYNPLNNDLTPEAMGGSVVTLRVPWGRRVCWAARPMLSDRAIGQAWPGAAHLRTRAGAPAFFWRVADGNGDWQTLHNKRRWQADETRWWPSVIGSDGTLSTNRGCQWFLDAENVYPQPGLDYSNALADRVELSSGNTWLALVGAEPAAMPAQGVGYWSPWLSTAPGVTSTVTLKMRGRELAPYGNGSPVVCLEFRNETGRNRQRHYLVGRDEQGVMHRAELTSGTYAWTNVQEAIVAPTGAVRMALFMGLTPCGGEVNFDDIDIGAAHYAQPDLVYHLPFENPTNGLVTLDVYDGYSNVVSRAEFRGVPESYYSWDTDRTIPAGRWWTTNTANGQGWALDLPVDFTNHPVEGPALQFLGSAVYTNLQLARTNEAITIAMWVRFHGYDRTFERPQYGLVNNGRRTDLQDGWAFGLWDPNASTNYHTTPAQLYFSLGAGRGTRRSGSTRTIPLDTWTHVAVTWIAGTSSNPVFYVNGLSTGSGTGDSLANKVAPEYFPPPFVNRMTISLNDASYRPGNAMLDDIRIYKRVLSAAEIQALYLNGP